jgi:hypothetical protein
MSLDVADPDAMRNVSSRGGFTYRSVTMRPVSALAIFSRVVTREPVPGTLADGRPAGRHACSKPSFIAKRT